MVRRLPGRLRGASSMGCLVSLLILVGALYYGFSIGEVYFRYYRLLDEMGTQARLAAALDDGTIQSSIQAAAQEIGLPEAAGGQRGAWRGTPRGRQTHPPTTGTDGPPL